MQSAYNNNMNNKLTNIIAALEDAFTIERSFEDATGTGIFTGIILTAFEIFHVDINKEGDVTVYQLDNQDDAACAYFKEELNLVISSIK
jgi:hypothetical protein